MYSTIFFRLVWPYLQRYLAKRISEFLADRRSKGRESVENERAAADCPPCPPCPPLETALATENRDSPAETVWYAMSGLLLGAAFSVMLYVLLKEDNLQANPGPN